MFSDNPNIDEVRDFFAHDRWATEACGCEVLEASKGHAVCAFAISDHHRNAMGNVMGGAIFTLADFSLAIACNVAEEPTVAVTNTIELGFYTAVVTDDLGAEIARMTATCFRHPARS